MSISNVVRAEAAAASVPVRRVGEHRIGIGVAAPASAQVLVVVPSISGSGTLAGSIPTCTTTGRAQRDDDAVRGGGGSVPESDDVDPATPQPTPAGHWTFVRWEGCPIPAANVWQLVGRADRHSSWLRAVFEDKVGPTVTQPTVIYSSAVDRTVTVSWGANEPVNLFTVLGRRRRPSTACGANGADVHARPRARTTFASEGPTSPATSGGALSPLDNVPHHRHSAWSAARPISPTSSPRHSSSRR